MKRAILVALGVGAIVSSAAAFSVGTGSEGLTQLQYMAKVRLIESSRTARLAGCESMPGSEREFCRVAAEGDKAVRLADTEAAYRRTREATRAAQRARIEARYQADRARCAILGGARRDACMVQVHANRGRALLDAAAPYEVRS